MGVHSAEGVPFDIVIPVAVIGAGACGLTAALAAASQGVSPVVFERDDSPRGSTSLSSGMIPAAGTRWQRAEAIPDTPEIMAQDLLRKTHGRTDPELAAAVCAQSAPTLEWLDGDVGVPLELVDRLVYPGQSYPRMHAPPARTGADLEQSLLAACDRLAVDIVTGAQVTDLHASADGYVRGFTVRRLDGKEEQIGCAALVLACSGFGGSPELVARHIPEIADALYFGHPGNTGDALQWGEALGAATHDLSGYQGHGSVAQPHGILITWALIMAGGIQVNARGERFSDETRGYSEQAVDVLRQPDGLAWVIYDRGRHEQAMAFPDYREAARAGAVREASDIATLAQGLNLPPDALTRTITACQGHAAGKTADPLGRDFTTGAALAAPFCGVKVTGALFHTQGGLVVDTAARVLRPDGTILPNLFAGGGAACGLSGPDVSGYLSGNGLLSAVVLGRQAGLSAAALAVA